MRLLAIMGSPRRKGNTSWLLDRFATEAQSLGATVEIMEVAKAGITACTGCGVCEKSGFCIFEDDFMSREAYAELRRADAVVAASPIYFYNVPSQMKALIDRTQTLWARKYTLKLEDPGRKHRRGFFLSLGATRGKDLFTGTNLTMKYFFDAIGARHAGKLTYRRIESPGAIREHPTVREDVKAAARDFLAPLLTRKKVLFLCRENACRSQMAAAFAKKLAGDEIEAVSAGSEPAERVNPSMAEAMKDIGLDMAFIRPKSIEEALAEQTPEMIITMGCGDKCPMVPGAKVVDWDLPDPSGKPMDFMLAVRDEIKKRVQEME